MVADFEAVLNATRQTATLAQLEKDFMGAFTCQIKSMALLKLRAPTMKVINLARVTGDPKVLREEVSVINMSAHGQTARFRATLEGERRWCGNEGETLTGAPVNMGKHELLCMLLDKRTLGCHHVTVEQREEARTLFVEEYTKFYMQASKWDCEKMKEANDAAAAALAANVCQEVKTETEGSSSMASGNLFQGTTWTDDEEEDDVDEVEEVAKETIAKEEAKRVLTSRPGRSTTSTGARCSPACKQRTRMSRSTSPRIICAWTLASSTHTLRRWTRAGNSTDTYL